MDFQLINRLFLHFFKKRLWSLASIPTNWDAPNPRWCAQLIKKKPDPELCEGVIAYAAQVWFMKETQVSFPIKLLWIGSSPSSLPPPPQSQTAKWLLWCKEVKQHYDKAHPPLGLNSLEERGRTICTCKICPWAFHPREAKDLQILE